jgi:hypothetical protein
MTGNYQYTIARERIADLHHEAERERLNTQARPRPIGQGRFGLLAKVIGTLLPARVSTT